MNNTLKKLLGISFVLVLICQLSESSYFHFNVIVLFLDQGIFIGLCLAGEGGGIVTPPPPYFIRYSVIPLY